MTRIGRGIGVALATLSLSGVASAQRLERDEPLRGRDALAEPAPAPKVEAPPTRYTPTSPCVGATGCRFYGWQTFLAGIGGFALGAGGTFALHESGFALAYSVWTLGAPAIHLAHKAPGKAVASLGLNLAVPLLGGQMTYDAALRDCRAEQRLNACEGVHLSRWGGLLVGMAIASVADSLLLGWEKAEARPARAASIGVQLGWSAGPRVGLGGTF